MSETTPSDLLERVLARVVAGEGGAAGSNALTVGDTLARIATTHAELAAIGAPESYSVSNEKGVQLRASIEDSMESIAPSIKELKASPIGMQHFAETKPELYAGYQAGLALATLQTSLQEHRTSIDARLAHLAANTKKISDDRLATKAWAEGGWAEKQLKAALKTLGTNPTDGHQGFEDAVEKRHGKEWAASLSKQIMHRQSTWTIRKLASKQTPQAVSKMLHNFKSYGRQPEGRRMYPEQYALIRVEILERLQCDS